jgi:tetratricopeptide (TPR) repeat protein
LSQYGAASPADSFPQAIAAAKKAIELDDTLAEAHTSLACSLAYYDYDFEQSLKEFERAIQLNPNYATAHHWLSNGVLSALGQFERAIAEGKRAVELEPLSLVINTDLGQDFFLRAATMKPSPTCAKRSKWILAFILLTGPWAQPCN